MKSTKESPAIVKSMMTMVFNVPLDNAAVVVGGADLGKEISPEGG